MLSSIQFCPRCAQPELQNHGPKQWRCRHCDFCYFHNTASTAGALIIYQQQLLLVERAIEPKKGHWDLPGGFVEYNESLEQGLARELEEELNLIIKPAQLNYFGSFANQYCYQNVLYHTCDSFFIYRPSNKPSLEARDDVAAWQWHPLSQLPMTAIAFSSVEQGLAKLIEHTAV